MSPFRIKAIDHVVLRVADIDRSRAFWVGVLGCKEDRVNAELGLYHLRAGASQIDLIPVAGKLGSAGGALAGKEGRNVDHVCLQIEPFDEAALRAHLTAHGIAMTDPQPRYGAEGTGPSIYLTDPDGNGVELKGPPTS
jgi:glyoxylase I family protein